MKKATLLLKYLLKLWQDAFFPATCHYCGQLFQTHVPQHNASSKMTIPGWNMLAPYLCADCFLQGRGLTAPFCTSCGLPFDSPHGVNHVCGRCERSPFLFHMARAAGRYDSALRALIHQYKYNGREWLAPALGTMLWEALIQHFVPSDIDQVIPVPLHCQRLYQRGFNQAALLIRKWPIQANAKVHWNAPEQWIATDILLRLLRTQPQTGLSGDQRAKNMRHAFQVAKPHAVQGKRILLIDDVMTTGATANACADALIQAGAESVDVLTLARAV